jgi:hypothetical protein
MPTLLLRHSINTHTDKLLGFGKMLEQQRDGFGPGVIVAQQI